MKKSIVDNSKERCFICGSYGQMEKHHIFGGNPNRKHSEKYGLFVYLCPECHRDHRTGVHGCPEMMKKLHQIGQAAFEKTSNRQHFLEIFGKNYLED